MKNLNLDYENQYAVRNHINTIVCDQISEDLKNYDDYQDGLYEIINGLSDVIYNYQAQKVAEAFDLSPFDCSESTGDRYNSYNEMAFDVIYNAYNEK